MPYNEKIVIYIPQEKVNVRRICKDVESICNRHSCYGSETHIRRDKFECQLMQDNHIRITLYPKGRVSIFSTFIFDRTADDLARTLGAHALELYYPRVDDESRFFESSYSPLEMAHVSTIHRCSQVVIVG